MGTFKLSSLAWLVFAFSIGMLFWYLQNRVISSKNSTLLDTGARLHKMAEEKDIPEEMSYDSETVFMKIGTDDIKFSQVDFEVMLYTKSFDSIEETEETRLPDKKIKVNFAGEQALRQKLLEDLIERKTLYQFILQDQDFDALSAVRLKNCLLKYKRSLIDLKDIIKTDEDHQYLKSRICELEIMNQYFAEVIAPRAVVSDEEVSKYFDENKESMIKGESIFFRQILLDNEQKANTVLSKLNSTNFLELAKTYSVATEKRPGEVLGPFARGELPPFFDVAFNLNPGQISGLIKSGYGFHIIKLEEKITKDKMRLELVKEKIIRKLKKQKVDEEFAKWLDIAMQKVNIEQIRKGS